MVAMLVKNHPHMDIMNRVKFGQPICSIRPRSRSYFICTASEGNGEQDPEPSTSAPAQPKVYTQLPDGRAPPPRPPMPYPPGVKYERVEKLGDDSWAGIAKVDRGETPSDFGRIALLVGGDFAALMLFATIGRLNHHEGLSFGAIFSTALPFLLGWFPAATLLGGYGKEAQGGNKGSAALTALKCWAVGAPLALVFRSISKGYLPDTSFIIVTIVVNTVLLVGWRTALAATTPDKGNDGGKGGARKNRKGNPFEFLQLLFGLTNRW